MIAWRLILKAAVVTGAGVAFSAFLVRWDVRLVLAAAAGTFVFIVGWRAISNGAHWNGDFVQLVSVGDVGCLIAGAASPALVARARRVAPRSLIPGVIGGVVGFVVNVVIL